MSGRARTPSRYALVFGRNLRAARQRRGLSQGAFAARLGLSASYICDVEYGRENPTLVQLERFAAALGLPLDAMFDQRAVDDE